MTSISSASARFCPQLLLALASLACLALAPRLPAVAIGWTNTAGGSWEAAQNWSPSTPVYTNQSYVTNAGTYTVVLDNSTANTDPGGAGSWLTLRGSGSFVALTLGSAAASPTMIFDFTNSTKRMLLTNAVAAPSTAALALDNKSTLLLSNGTLEVRQGHIYVGSAAGASPFLGIHGGTLRTSNSVLAVGAANSSTGSLEMTSGTLQGATVYVGGDTGTRIGVRGTWVAGGTSTTLLQTAVVGTGTNSVGRLFLQDSAFLLSDAFRIAAGSGAGNATTGFVYVTGGALTVTGAANVLVGGTVNSYGALIVSNGTVDVLTGGMRIGSFASGVSAGEMQVLGGRVSIKGALDIGHYGAATGFVTVSDSGVLELAGNLNLGNGSWGQLVAKDGGTLRFTGQDLPTIGLTSNKSLVVASNAVIEFKNAGAFLTSNAFPAITFQGSNTLSLLNSTNASLAEYTVGNGQSFAALRLAGASSLWQSTNLMIAAGGSLGGSGRIGSDVATNAGVISPGNSPGNLSFAGDLTLLSSSILNMELAGTNAGTFDRILVDGAFARDGALNVSLLSYTPSAGDSFDLFDFGSASGSFGALSLPSLSSGLSWDTSQFNASGVLLVTAIPEPSTALALLGAAAFLATLRRRSRA
jgi:fibronectin-binding autotransporter adhesin